MIPTPPNRCRVCGCGALQTDEVVHAGRLLLAECERCHHRWTQPLPDRVRPLRALRTRGSARAEVAQAA